MLVKIKVMICVFKFIFFLKQRGALIFIFGEDLYALAAKGCFCLRYNQELRLIGKWIKYGGTISIGNQCPLRK